MREEKREQAKLAKEIAKLGSASVSLYFGVHAMIFSGDAPKLKAALHSVSRDRRIKQVNTWKEYFRVTLDEIKEVVRNNHDKTVEFVDVPQAPQFRETLLLLKSGK